MAIRPAKNSGVQSDPNGEQAILNLYTCQDNCCNLCFSSEEGGEWVQGTIPVIDEECLNACTPEQCGTEMQYFSGTVSSGSFSGTVSSGSSGSGDSCMDIVTCMNACSAPTCQSTCLDAGSAEAAAVLQTLFACLGQACPEGSAETCLTEAQGTDGACYDELMACAAG